MTTSATSPLDSWPDLPLEAWSDTCATLHMLTQIVGKIRLAQTPWVNHSWHVTLYVTARGLTTSPIPYGSRTFQIDFDFVDHHLQLLSSDGGSGGFAREPQPVAAFYARLIAEMAKLGLHVDIKRKPNEVADPIPFDQDESHHAYHHEYANRFWRILVQSDRVFKAFRARFLGKCSPVHFFWGAPDLAVTRFSGRSAPEHPGGVPNLPDWVVREAYSQEVSSCGFWPVVAQYLMPRSIPMPIPNHLGSQRHRSGPAQLSTAPIFGNLFCRTTWFANRVRQTTRYSIFCRLPMKPQPIWPSGIAASWNVATISRVAVKNSSKSTGRRRSYGNAR
jgi:hypothetical protein